MRMRTGKREKERESVVKVRKKISSKFIDPGGVSSLSRVDRRQATRVVASLRSCLDGGKLSSGENAF